MTASTPLPTFIIGGAPRSGTTYLAEVLSRHPEVFMPKPLLPEPKVFFGPRLSVEAYRERYRKLFAQANGHRLLGEKTSNYLENPDLGELIQAVAPDVQMIFIVREPVARAYSNYLWSTKNRLETLSFEEAVAREGTRASPLPPENLHAKPFDYLIRGNYDALSAPYMAAFEPGRIRFFLYEDITLRPKQFVRELQEFVGAEPLPFEQLDVGVVNSAREVGPALDPQTDHQLRERMRPAVQRFAALTGLDISSWGY
jgi:Sulfotransferase domain